MMPSLMMMEDDNGKLYNARGVVVFSMLFCQMKTCLNYDRGRTQGQNGRLSENEKYYDNGSGSSSNVAW